MSAPPTPPALRQPAKLFANLSASLHRADR